MKQNKKKSENKQETTNSTNMRWRRRVASRCIVTKHCQRFLFHSILFTRIIVLESGNLRRCRRRLAQSPQSSADSALKLIVGLRWMMWLKCRSAISYYAGCSYTLSRRYRRRPWNSSHLRNLKGSSLKREMKDKEKENRLRKSIQWQRKSFVSKACKCVN